jgi:Raf kinase inhibitor-like YbhB/YbcL family protein
LTSTFQDGDPIAAKYTEDGDNVSPPLTWAETPEGTKSFVLICDDPDAPSPRNPRPDPWVHWVIYNIPADASELPEGVPRDAQLSMPAGAKQGVNSWDADNLGYRGPSPPPRSGTHRYFFKLYALDTELDLGAGQVTKSQLLQAMQGHILAQGQLMGTYERK